ncbi:helix-turn-helix transcriptional regulator [Lacrimispora sp.]|jgi:DNA-binding XRE family transcriptional regulator|uniref:helix-turn-helix transcriptional regulator n=1 Tax=Lacrimispora sp. TaxID=2719234 RepID=UPI0028AEBE01|nr:helix-turn-helix transcriptional regulator [Lacrimispora sp.]
MENRKIGAVIRTLRQEKSMTQKQLADQLNISDKAVSKWERGQGLPDISLIPNLTEVLGVDMENLLAGDLAPNESDGGNMKNTKYYVCPSCNSLTLCTGGAEISCCGKKLTSLELKKAEEHEKLIVEEIEGDWYITSTHPMNKECYISFVAFASGDQIQVIKQYPEWYLNVRIPKRGHKQLIWYSTKLGLLSQFI